MKAYAERMKELTKRDIELAQFKFTHAEQMWGRVKTKVKRTERMKESVTRHVNYTCMEEP